jgi:hypothetical protein
MRCFPYKFYLCLSGIRSVVCFSNLALSAHSSWFTGFACFCCAINRLFDHAITAQERKMADSGSVFQKIFDKKSATLYQA